MRRFRTALFLSLLPVLTYAASESAPREIGPRERGRAVLVTPVKDLTDYDRAQLAEQGLVVTHAIGGGRYLARLNRGAATVRDERIRSVEALTAEDKVDRAALRAAATMRGPVAASVIFHSDVPFDQARASILAAGGAMDIFVSRYLPAQRIEARVPSQSLLALAADEDVLAIAGPRKYTIASDNATTAALSKVDVVQAAPYGLSGDGVTVSLFELAAGQATHVEFQGRATLPPSTSGGGSGDARHATHVAGTIGAGGVRPSAKGMAPKARIHQFCVNYETNTCTGEWLQLKDENLKPLGITVDNNSWGYVWGWWTGDLPVWSRTDIYWGAYDLILAAPIDKIATDRDILFVHSAGNDGTIPTDLRNDPWKSHHHVDEDYEEIKGQVHCVSVDNTGGDCPAHCNATAERCEIGLHHSIAPFDTLGTTASAKNVIAVGAVTDSKAIVSFSSRGPAKDGRVKPDLVARGASVESSVPTDSYARLSGTSMAAPAVTGMAALVTEQWKKSYSTQPSAAAVKALLIAGAEDLGNPGPDYTFGFGLVNLQTSVDLIRADEGQKKRIRELSFAAGQQQQQEVSVIVSQAQNLRVVLNWADPYIAYDPPGSDVADVALVNDLDLFVIDPSGATVLPWILDKSAFETNATRGVNTVDNVEMVEIANAAPGTYRVIARGRRVTDGPQKAVLVTNARTVLPCIDVQEGSGNDSSGSAYGNLVPGQLVAGGLCSPSDVDFYKFNVTEAGQVGVTITTVDTAVRATLTGTGISRTQEIPALSTATLNADANTVPNPVTLKIEPSGTVGAEPAYTFVPTFPEKRQPKRRITRH